MQSTCTRLFEVRLQTCKTLCPDDTKTCKTFELLTGSKQKLLHKNGFVSQIIYVSIWGTELTRGN